MSASGGGGFCRVFTTNVAPQCRAFNRALEIEKLLFLGLEGAGDTNDWCIIVVEQHHEKTGFCIYEKNRNAGQLPGYRAAD